MFHVRMLLASGMMLLVSPLTWGDDPKKADQPFNDNTFITHAANCIQRDIEISKLATTHARNDEVKKFAQKVVDDATTAEADLKKAATSASVIWPTKLDEESQTKLNTFKDYKGTNFDSDYIKCMIEHHEMAVKGLTRASKEAKNSELRNFATKELPMVEKCVEPRKRFRKT